jgi:arginine utilization protein RocB
MRVGRPAHLGAPFEGISANLLAAELVRTVDYNPALCDRNGAELGTPPITLRLQDAKTSYDVSTPQFTWCAINLLSYRRGPQETLDLLCTVAAEALASARACAYAQQAGRPDPAPLGAGRVYPIAELYDRVHRHGGEAALSAVAAMEAAALERHQGDAFAQLRVDQAVAEALWQSSGLQGPAAVIGFVGPHYPLVTLDATTPRGSRLQAAIERQVATITAETGVPIRMRPLFTGISDMSFLARPQAAIDRAALLANVAAASTRRRIAAALGETLDVPVVNIGPWGRDYHQRTERLYTPYAFTTLPELLWRVVGDLLAGTEN